VPLISFASDEEIAAIGRGLLSRSLPKPQWTHQAHFAAALWLISCRQDLDAARDMPGFIRAYNEATGVANTEVRLVAGVLDSRAAVFRRRAPQMGRA
jgi:hypothetical protein